MKKHSFSSNRLVTILISFFLIIWVSNQLNAGVICVSNTGDNDNTGTPGSPFLTIQKALDSASAGDTIKIAAGIYTEYLNTKCSNILLGGYNESYTNNKRDIFLNKTYIVGASSVMYYDANSSTIDGFVFDCGSSVTDAAAKLYNGSVLSHNVFLNLTAIAANNIETYGGAVVINNTVYEGSNAIVINSGTGTPLIKNNIFCYTSFGINTVGYDASVRTYNCVYGNTFSYTGFDSNPGNGDIAMNPVFRDVNNYDFRILEISSCLDKGDPSDSPGNEPHPYNSRIDIGAYGGTAWSPYLTPIPDAPSLCVPANNLENASRDIILKWNDIEEIDSFHVQVTTDPSFVTGIIMDDDAVSDTALVLTDLLYHKTYFWRVNASVTLGTGEWSEVWQFSTIELDQPALYLPSDRKINPGEFMWFSTANADNYIIQFSTDSLFTGIVLDSLLTDTIYSGDSLGNNTYYWRIKALNADDESPWSVIRSFIINSELLFCEDFESYPPGILADAPGSPWIRYSSSRVGDVINTNVHEGDQCFQINSFTTSTEIDYVKFD
ncbi:MAG: DUF1565 domain-containing protein, partial [Bacteroidales bacterium]|nr:DUF1565 domain-containing protein [Bacteroidales bacterium]